MAYVDINTLSWERTNLILYKTKNQKHSDSTKKLSAADIIKMLEFVIDNIFFMFDGRAFNRQLAFT